MELGGIGIGIGIDKMELTPCLIKPTQFWHIFILKVSRNCDLPLRNEIFLTNQFSILEN